MGLSSKQAIAADAADTSQGWPQTGNAWLDIASPRCGWDGDKQQQQQQQQQLRCPRCGSHNTKFSYYNNYSRMQPRHHCKACRRYWTQGGTLRDVPVGGGHKSKRQKKTAHANSAEADPFRGFNSEQFSHVDLERSIFPSLHRITMMYSAAGGDEAMSLLSPPLLLLPETMTETNYSGSGIFNPPPVSASSSSSHLSNQIEQEVTTADNLLTLIPGSTTEWLQDPPSMLSNYYSPWLGDAWELAAFRQPAAADD